MQRATLGVMLVAMAGCSGATSASPAAPIPVPADTAPPQIPREMRGIWIATVANIDWPSRTGLTAAAQQAELVDLLDKAVAGGFNTIVFHVRPAGDAVYRSSIEPWGAMLSGTQGTDPGYDPLAFAVTEAHRRGLQLHAWINPFRAGNSRDTLLLAPTHQFHVRRDLLRVYGSQLWFDPGEPGVQDHVMRVVSDIVQRYDVDGVHADDYFYPYPENDASGKAIDFPDSATYARSGSTLTRADWRRDNVDRFVQRMYREVHAIKPTISVGISPFGIWRPGNPASVSGLDAYAAIYADSRKWLQQGWVDYLAPQLYWAASAPAQSYPALLDWWLAQNSAGRHVWPGLAAYRVADGTASAFSATEIPGQVSTTRTRAGGDGHILFNATSTLKKSGGALSASLATLYASRALVPASPWLDTAAPGAPGAPSVVVIGTTTAPSLQIAPAAGERPRWYVVRSRATNVWTTRVLFATENTLALPSGTDRVLVNAVDDAGMLGNATSWLRP